MRRIAPSGAGLAATAVALALWIAPAAPVQAPLAPSPVPVRISPDSLLFEPSGLVRIGPSRAGHRGDGHLVEIGTMPGVSNPYAAGGDVNTDNTTEVLLPAKEWIDETWAWSTRIYEHQGGGVFMESVLLGFFIPFFGGDIDGDGYGDYGGQVGDRLVVYEALDFFLLPQVPIWTSGPLGAIVGYPSVADTDGDQKLEILHSANQFGTSFLQIWENTADNQFSMTYQYYINNVAAGPKAVADFDKDTIPEIVVTDGNGGIYVFESTGDNSYVNVWSSSIETWNLYGCVATDDMDGNSWPEFCVLGSDPVNGWVLKVFESNGGGGGQPYREVYSWQHDNGWIGVPSLVGGDFDGDGDDELAAEVSAELFLLEPAGGVLQVLEMAVESPDRIHDGLMGLDANQNGKDEIFWLGLGEDGIGSAHLTSVLEWDGVVSSVAAPAPDAVGARPSPNPGAGPFIFSIPERALGGRLTIFDPLGRRVAALDALAPRVTWSPPPTSGVYLWRLEAPGAKAASGRFIVLE